MRYSEFKREVENMGFVVIDSGATIYVDKDKDRETLMSIGVNSRFQLDPGWSGFNKLTEDQQLKVYDLAYQLAKTPPAEREEEKRYWLRFTTPTLLKDLIPNGYLNIHRESNELSLSSDKKDTEYFKTIFTESEIAEMDITGFCKEEVK